MKFIFIFLTGVYLLFSCSYKSKENVENHLSKRTNVEDREYKNFQGVTYYTEFNSRIFKYTPSKQIFLDDSSNLSTKLKFGSAETNNRCSEKLEYVSKIPDLSEDKERKNLTVYFEFNSAVLKEKEINKLKNFIRDIKRKNVKNIVLKGYTDELGSEEYNYKLAYNRALAVKNYLGKHFKDIRVNYLIYAKGKCCFISTSHEKNRRVEIEIY